MTRLRWALVVCNAIALVGFGWGLKRYVELEHFRHPYRAVDPDTAALKVLWLGNSHTYRNRVPERVQDLADAHGGGPIYIETRPGAKLETHFETLADDLASRDWDVVVAQDWSGNANSDLLALRDDMREVKRLAGDIRVVAYENWRYQSKGDYASQEQIDAVFCALETDGIEVAYAGHAIHDAYTYGLDPLTADGNHHNALGAEIAARTLHATLTGEPTHTDGFDDHATPDLFRDKLASGPFCLVPAFGETHSDTFDRTQSRVFTYRATHGPPTSVHLIQTPSGSVLLDVRQHPLATVEFDALLRRHELVGGIQRVLQLSRSAPGERKATALGKDGESFEAAGFEWVVHHVDAASGTAIPPAVHLEVAEHTLWAIGDSFAPGCVPLVDSAEEARARATWLERFVEEYPDAWVLGTSGRLATADELNDEVSRLHAYAESFSAADGPSMPGARSCR